MNKITSYRIYTLTNNICGWIGGIGAFSVLLIMQNRQILPVSDIPLIGLTIASYALIYISTKERLDEDIKDAKYIEEYVRNCFRRTTNIEMEIDKR